VSEGTGPVLYRRAKQLIPGGTQLLSKRPELFLPEIWPSYYSKAKGVEVYDLDGNRYIDMSLMGVGACVLGYGDADVDRAARDAIEAGPLCTLNAPEEVELAELLIRLHPWASMVRYTRTGGEAMAVAARIARAATGREIVAFCGYHGWADWYLAANLSDGQALDGHLMPGLPPAGVPASLRGTAFPFHYNRLEQLKQIVDQSGGKIAAVIMEPQRSQKPAGGFLQNVRDIASSIGAVLIFDEITTGFRMTTGGIHLLHNVTPDLAVFAKAMSNGYAMAAVIGIEEVMQAAQDSFISSTNWTERIGPAAAVAAIKKHERIDAARHIIDIGNRVFEGWKTAAAESGLAIRTEGLSALNHFSIEIPEAIEATTLFTQLMLERGYLAYNQFKPSYAHQDRHIEDYCEAVSEVFHLIREAIDSGQVRRMLKGPAAKTGFYRLT